MAAAERRLGLGLGAEIGPSLAAARVRDFLERSKKVQLGLGLGMFERDQRV